MTQKTKLLAARRRDVLKALGAGGFSLALGGFAGQAWAQSGRKIKIGYVSPQTGPLAAFGEADKFVIGEMRDVLKAGISIAGKSYPVEIIVKDSQSNPNKA